MNFPARYDNRCPPWRPVLRCIVGTFALLAAAVPASAEIAGDIVRVGFLGTRGAVIRTGEWTPVVVDLRMQNQNTFDGFLRVRQFDRDGDVYVDQVPVHLFGEGSAQKSYTLYTVANPARSAAYGIVVELLSTEDGDASKETLVEVISGGVPVPFMKPPVDPWIAPADATVVLNVSDRPLGKLRMLLDPEIARRFDRPIVVAHGAPEVIPEKWIGLEMVDSIVWDDADPTRLTAEQEQALIDWVRQGGRLILAAARTASAVAQSRRLGPLLPVDVGRVTPAADLPAVRQHLASIVAEAETGYRAPFAVTTCTLREGDTVRQVVHEPALDSVFVASRRIGRGHLVFVAASLRDVLADAEAQPDVCYKRLLELRNSKLGEESSFGLPLVQYLDREIGFFGQSGLFLAVMLLFAIGYVLLATLGSWKVLASRNLLRHSWSVLAVLAAAASLLSIVGVQAFHGVGREVHQLTVIDGTEGEVGALASAYFGVRTPVHTKLDLWVPGNYLLDAEPEGTDCTLRPLLEWRELVDQDPGYTDPTRYRLRPATAEIHGLPVRATLKQLEGRWRGDMPGAVFSSLRATDLRVPHGEKEAAEVLEYGFAAGSWIRNDLDVDLKNCYLLLSQIDAFKTQTFSEISRAAIDQVIVLPLGELKHGEQVDVHARCYTDRTGQLAPRSKRRPYWLSEQQKRWGREFAIAANLDPFGGTPTVKYDLRDYESAVLLGSLATEIDPLAFRASPISGYPVFSAARMRQLDISSLLTANAALLIGFSDEAGPVRLCARTGDRPYEAIKPGKSRCVYRIILPLNRSGG